MRFSLIVGPSARLLRTLGRDDIGFWERHRDRTHAPTSYFPDEPNVLPFGWFDGYQTGAVGARCFGGDRDARGARKGKQPGVGQAV